MQLCDCTDDLYRSLSLDRPTTGADTPGTRELGQSILDQKRQAARTPDVHDHVLPADESLMHLCVTPLQSHDDILCRDLLSLKKPLPINLCV